MSLSYIVSHHFLENRLYVSNMDGNELKGMVEDPNGEPIGASVRSYGDFMGSILCKLGFASKLTVGDESFYVNNKSFCQFVARNNELTNLNPSSAQEAAVEIHKLYLDHKKTGYEDIDVMEAEMKKTVDEGGVRDIAKLLQQLALRSKWRKNNPLKK